MEKRYDVFISYSTEDQKVAEGICGYLERNGCRCFVAYRDIPRGMVWAAAITEAIEESAMMVVVFSKYFNVSPHTDREIALASKKKIPILTYRIADDEMTGVKEYYLTNLNWVDAFPNPENYFGQLLDCVRSLIGMRTQTLDPEKPAVEKPMGVTKSKAPFGLPSLICSILGLVWLSVVSLVTDYKDLEDFVYLIFYVGIVLSIVGMVMGIVGSKRIKGKHKFYSDTPILIVGKILGIIGVASWGLVLIFAIIGVFTEL